MSTVSITSGDLIQFGFPSGNGVVQTITANQASLPIYKSSPWTTVQGFLTSSTFGLITATITIQGTNDVYSGVGFSINGCVTNNASAVVTNPLNLFAGGQEMLNDVLSPAVAVGMLVVGPGVPLGTIVSVVTNTGSITLSNNLSASSGQGGVTLRFFNNAWATTVLGTITLSGTTSATAPFVTDAFSSVSTFKFIRANVTNITGTGATVYVTSGI